MQTYISLLTFTDKGNKEVKKTAKRASEFKKIAEENNIHIVETYWLNGPYDGIHIFRVENEAKAMAHSYSLCSFGNVNTQTYRAFDDKEIEPILRSIPEPFDLNR